MDSTYPSISLSRCFTVSIRTYPFCNISFALAIDSTNSMCVISFDICIKPTPVLKIELLRNGHSKSSTRKQLHIF
nr:MAG TPA: hypothetical protein [Caudoviricetes sp.]